MECLPPEVVDEIVDILYVVPDVNSDDTLKDAIIKRIRRSEEAVGTKTRDTEKGVTCSCSVIYSAWSGADRFS